MITLIEPLFHDVVDRKENSHKHRDFAYRINGENAYGDLIVAYKKEVEKRCGTFLYSPQLEDVVAHVVAWLTDTNRRPWLILGGNVGTGKTTLLHAIHTLGHMARNVCKSKSSEAARNHKYDIASEWDALSRKFLIPSIFNATTLSTWAAHSESEEMFNEATTLSFLAIDDLGTEPTVVKLYGTEKLPLVELLSVRYDKMAPTIITTNLGPDEIAERYGERIADRLREMADAIGFSGPSFRSI